MSRRQSEWACRRKRLPPMRQLPETLLEVIREFEKEHGALVGLGLVAACFAANDDAFSDQPPFAVWIVVADERDGQLRAELEAPARPHVHRLLGKFNGVFGTLLRIGSKIEGERGDSRFGQERGFAERHREMREGANMGTIKGC